MNNYATVYNKYCDKQLPITQTCYDFNINIDEGIDDYGNYVLMRCVYPLSFSRIIVDEYYYENGDLIVKDIHGKILLHSFIQEGKELYKLYYEYVFKPLHLPQLLHITESHRYE